MSFLNPWFLVAGTAVLVPVIVHFFYRQESKTFSFPAIRYLFRTEKERARQIRTHQLLLLALRMLIVVLLVLMGARLYLDLAGGGGSHEPTALALVIDNSLSSTVVEDGRLRLDTLKAMASVSVANAGPDDLIWVIRAGTPWEVAVPGGVSQAQQAIDETEAAHSAGELGGALERALVLVGESHLAAREVHLFTDLQATAFSEPVRRGGTGIPVVIFRAPAAGGQNRGILKVEVGDGLAPLAGRRGEVAVAVGGGGGGDGGGTEDTVAVRLYVEGQVRAAARVTSGSVARMPVGPFPAGKVFGYAELDADLLTADDRRYFSFLVREPTPVAVVGGGSFFLTEALAVLEENARILVGGVGRAATIIAVGGEGIEARGSSQAAVVVPHADPARLPALNRSLAEAGVPWRYAVRAGGGGARVEVSALPVEIDELNVFEYFRLEVVPEEAGLDGELGELGEVGEQVGARGEGDGNDGLQDEVLAEEAGRSGSVGGESNGLREPLVTLTTGEPWLLEGVATTGPYILLASPLDDRATELPVSAAMVPLLEWAIERWSGGGGEHSQVAGEAIRPPAGATAVRTPAGVVHPVDGDQPFFATATTGIYEVLRGDSVIEAVPVNAPPSESLLAPVPASDIKRIVPGAQVVESASAWSRNIFRAGRGVEPWRALGVLLLVLLLVESVVAAAKGLRVRASGEVAPQATTRTYAPDQ